MGATDRTLSSLPASATITRPPRARKDRIESARFFRELLEFPEAPSWGLFTNVQLNRRRPGPTPGLQRPGEIRHEHGGRGGHAIELITRPYL